MRRRLEIAVVVLTMLWLVPTTAAAQERSGFWIAFGGGYGSAKVTFDEIEGEDNDRESSAVGHLRGGWTLNERVLIGGEFNIWSKDVDVEPGLQASANIYNALFTVTAYPGATSRFFVKGGIGGAFLDADFDVQGGGDFSVELGQGLGLIAGAGYDIPVNRRISVTPAVNFWYGRTGDMKFAGQTLLTNGRFNVIDVTVSLTFH